MPRTRPERLAEQSDAVDDWTERLHEWMVARALTRP
jgi:hypothetical protein